MHLTNGQSFKISIYRNLSPTDVTKEMVKKHIWMGTGGGIRCVSERRISCSALLQHNDWSLQTVSIEKPDFFFFSFFFSVHTVQCKLLTFNILILVLLIAKYTNEQCLEYSTYFCYANLNKILDIKFLFVALHQRNTQNTVNPYKTLHTIFFVPAMQTLLKGQFTHKKKFCMDF